MLTDSMNQTQTTERRSDVTYAVSDTGPLISAFQSDSFGLLCRIFPNIYVPQVCVAELQTHGWQETVDALSPPLVCVQLTEEEELRSLVIADEIARHSGTRDPNRGHHLGEAQAIVLAGRSDHQNAVLLIDERIPRQVARQRGMRLSGFPGVLLLATQAGLISPEELRLRLESCRAQGTHYGISLIQQVFEMAQRNWR